MTYWCLDNPSVYDCQADGDVVYMREVMANRKCVVPTDFLFSSRVLHLSLSNNISYTTPGKNNLKRFIKKVTGVNVFFLRKV